MPFLRRCRILAAAVTFALLGAMWAGAPSHAAAAAGGTAGCSQCSHDGNDGAPSGGTCDLACSAAAAILGDTPAAAVSPARDEFAVLCAASSGLFAPPDPYPPRLIG